MAKKKLSKLKKDAQSKYKVLSWPAFDMQEPKTKYVYRPEFQQKIIYISNMKDGFVRAVAGNIIEAELGRSNYTNKEVSAWLKKYDLTTERDLYAFVLQYNQEGSDIVD